MAKLPKVKIGGHRYRVIWKKELARLHGVAGMSCASNLSIILDPAGKQSHISAVFWHEVVEQINYLHELNLPHETITTLGECWYQVLADNPRIVKEFSGR
jgi:hypothetical protein